jgi:hypothetical protein
MNPHSDRGLCAEQPGAGQRLNGPCTKVHIKDAPGERSIQISAGLLHQAPDEGLAAMVGRRRPLLSTRQEARAVCLIKAKNADGENFSVPSIVSVSPLILRRALWQSAHWEKSTAKGDKVRIDPPRDVVDQIAGMVGEWPFPAVYPSATELRRSEGELSNRFSFAVVALVRRAHPDDLAD